MTKTQQNLLNQIDANGSVTVRSTTRNKYNAAQALRTAGIVNFRGVRTPRGADYTARNVYRRTAA